MAQRKVGRVVETRLLGGGAREVTLAFDEPLGFVGGQYLIVDSGALLPGGDRGRMGPPQGVRAEEVPSRGEAKAAKRAYSILSPDREQTRATFWVKRIGDGPASSFMHRVAPGDEVPFSGPWGQYLPEDARPRRTLVFASDTGITAALGLISGGRFAPHRETTELVWARQTGDFVPDALVRERFPEVQIAVLPPVGHPERLAAARGLVTADAESVYLSGDGDLLYPLRDALAPAVVRMECFFNNPAKKSA
jgi:ferredoxin-NADP reductase